MLFLSRVRAGVLLSSVVLSSVVLTLSAILIYHRISYPLEFGVYDEANPGGPKQPVERDIVDLAVSRYGNFIGGPPGPRPDVMVSGNPHHLTGPVIIPPGTDIDTLLATSIAIINIVTVPLLLVADMFKRKTVISSIAVEASWLFVVWVLWLTCAAYAAWCSQTQLVNFVRCQTSQAQCLEYEFLEICSFMNWIIVMLYSNTLFTLAVINHMRRQPIWFTPVKDTPRLPPLVFAGPVQTVNMDEVKMLLSGSSFSLPPHDPRRPPIRAAPSVPSLALHSTQAYRRGDDTASGSGVSPLLPSGEHSPLESQERRRSTITLPPDYSERPGAHPSSP
ncbi:hypothetical protein PENSPDRAFT_647381 [Peniophora sp. CONT]|nr:hypothetical protein PENSPDRAFT_647381 [Peniophora sp. CONT]